jgi:hypothetical protein
LTSTLAYDAISKKCTEKIPISTTARHGLAVVSFDNKIYVVGRGPQPDESGTNINKVFHVGDGG